MSDYISREDALLCATGEYADDSFEDSIRETECKKIAKRLKELKPADVRENIHGEWEEWKVGKYEGVPICSVCKHGFPLGFNQYNFCPNCGADMRGE